MRNIILLFLAVLTIWAGAFFVVINVFPTWEIRGQFGDLFGSINALFSGFAFVALIYTIFLQRSELSLQREELRLQREEMIESRKELASQGKTQKHQYLASIAQLKVYAANIEVDALKMESEQKIASARGDFVKRIREQSDQINQMVHGLENS